MSTHLYVVANGMDPMNKGNILVAVLQRLDRLEPRYKLSTLVLLFLNTKHFYLDSLTFLFCFSFLLWSLRFFLRPH